MFGMEREYQYSERTPIKDDVPKGGVLDLLRKLLWICDISLSEQTTNPILPVGTYVLASELEVNIRTKEKSIKRSYIGLLTETHNNHTVRI